MFLTVMFLTVDGDEPITNQPLRCIKVTLLIPKLIKLLEIKMMMAGSFGYFAFSEFANFEDQLFG